MIMPSIFDIFASQLGENELDQIANKIGADRGQTRDAITMTLPALIEALSRKAEQAGGAEDLHAKLGQAAQGRTTGGSMLDQLNDIIAGEPGGASRPSPYSSPAPTPQGRTSSPQGDILPPTTPPMTPSSGGAATRTSAPSQRPPAPSAQASPMPDILGELLGTKRGKVSDAVSKTSGLSQDQAGSLISMLGPILSGMLGSQAAEKQMSPSDLTEMLRQDRSKVQQAPGGDLVGKMLDQDGDGDFDMSDMLKLGMGLMSKK
jgi:hypothetical protein